MEGLGTIESPFLVASAEDLNAVRNNLAAYYKQTADIDLVDVESWTPIGEISDVFTGQYDGDNHKISNMTISVEQSYAGLFGCVCSICGVAVQNVTLENVNLVDPSDKAGPLIAFLYAGDVINCHAQGVITINSNLAYEIGGLIGQLQTDTSIIDDFPSEYEQLKIENCSADVDILGDFTSDTYKAEDFGGLIAKIVLYDIPILIKRCFATGDILVSVPDNTGPILRSFSNAGGFIGALSAEIGAVIQECFATGNLHVGVRIGGFIGRMYGGVIENCFSRGNLLVPEEYLSALQSFSPCSGFAGIGWEFEIRNCYVACQVPAGMEDSTAFTSYGTTEKIFDCFFDSDLCDLADPAATGESTLNMKKQSTFAGWDFAGVWEIDSSINDGYPHLRFTTPGGSGSGGDGGSGNGGDAGSSDPNNDKILNALPDADGNILLYDSFNIVTGELLKKVGRRLNEEANAEISYADMAEGGVFAAFDSDGELIQTGAKGDTLEADAALILYQLTDPYILYYTPQSLQVENGETIQVAAYFAGVLTYSTEQGGLVFDAAVSDIESIKKAGEFIEFTAEIAANGLSATVSELTDGDPVFVIAKYAESPEIEVLHRAAITDKGVLRSQSQGIAGANKAIQCLLNDVALMLKGAEDDQEAEE